MSAEKRDGIRVWGVVQKADQSEFTNDDRIAFTERLLWWLEGQGLRLNGVLSLIDTDSEELDCCVEEKE